MKREDLAKIGLTEEALEKAGLDKTVIDSIMELYGKGITKFKSDAESLQTELDTANASLTEAGQTIEKFKGMDIDAIKQAAEDYKVEAEKAKTEAAAQILSLKRGHALDEALKSSFKVKDIKAVKAYLDDEKIQFNEKDGSFVGLKEQIDPLLTEKDYLFIDESETPKIVDGAKSKSVLPDAFDAAMKKGAGIPTE
jgi:hypothetical protein